MTAEQSGEQLSRKYPDDCVLPLTRSEDTSILNGLEIYAPREFKATTLMVGNPESSVAVCTSWSDPWTVVDEVIVNRVSIVAPLRTPNGIGVLLSNLARNPQINQIVIWSGGEWDNGNAALLPRDYLQRLFVDGIDDKGFIIGTRFCLPPELIADNGLEIIRTVLGNVQLISEIRTPEELRVALDGATLSKAYMEPHRFPEFEIQTVETLPSERHAMGVSEPTLDQAWIHLLDRILRYGNNTFLETGGAKVRELEFFRTVITNQGTTFELPKWMQGLTNLPLTQEGLESYFRTKILPAERFMVQLIEGVPKFVRPDSVSYLYAEDMFAYPRDPIIDNAVTSIYSMGGIAHVYAFLSENARYPHPEAEQLAQVILSNGLMTDVQKIEALLEIFVPPTNQISKLIERIKKTPDDADKIFVLWEPEVHGMRDRARPCALMGEVLVRNERVDMHVVFRTHDMAKAWVENVYGFWRLQTYIAEQTGLEPGVLIVDSESAHMYQVDVEWVQKLVAEQIWNKEPRIVFNDGEMADPRGNWVVNVVDGQIICVLQDPATAQPLYKLEGRTAKNIIGQLRHLGLLEQPDHALDIGSQLKQAEICNLLGIPFVQDRSIDFHELRKRMGME